MSDRHRTRRRSALHVPWVVVVPGVLCAAIAHFVAPLAGAFYAFTDWTGLGSYHVIGFDNFVRIFQTSADRAVVVTTLRLAVLFVIAVTAIGLVLAVALNKTFRWSGNVLRSLFFVPAVMIPLSVTQVWKYILDYNGPLNIVLRAVGLESWTRNWLGDFTWAPWAILLVMVWQYTGYAMVIIHAGLQVIPEEVYEAASLDGASAWHKFRYVTFPLLAPSLTVVLILMTITGLRAFDQVLGLTGGGPVGSTDTLASRFYQITWVYGQYGYGTSMALLLTLLVVAVGVLQLVGLRRREESVSG
jgi:raffinose/stachyose/melibiose transport system permease protein